MCRTACFLGCATGWIVWCVMALLVCGKKAALCVIQLLEVIESSVSATLHIIALLFTLYELVKFKIYLAIIAAARALMC